MGKFIDLTGQKFNKLTVLERDYTNPDKKRAYWKCQCDCGNIIITRGESLRTGHTKSCGKCKVIKEFKPKYQDYTGQHIGRLTIIERYIHPTDNKHTYWKCICDCGNECIKRSDSFITVPVPSCGCYKKEHASQQWAAQLEGQRFGKLLVKRKIPHQELRSLWECECDCGNIIQLPSRYLLSIGVKSCGCDTRSNGELEIRQILLQKNINFKEQYTFDDCLTENNNKIRFDFAILKNEKVIGIIEFNGQQHYECVEYFGGEKKFLIIQQRDQIKREYCKNNNIQLLEIPYTELGQINIDNWLKELEQKYYE